MTNVDANTGFRDKQLLDLEKKRNEQNNSEKPKKSKKARVDRPSREGRKRKNAGKNWVRPDYRGEESDQDEDEDNGDFGNSQGDDFGATSNHKGKKYNVFGGRDAKMNAEGDYGPSHACMSNPYLIDTSCAIELYHSSYLKNESRGRSPTRR